MAKPTLSPFTILDLSEGPAGGYCSKLLAGFGARVIKVERRGTGDPLRGSGPFAGNRAGLERSIPFLWLNTGKKSITLDYRKPQGRELLNRLVGLSDVVLENVPPAERPRLQLSLGDLQKHKPTIILASIAPFGQTGPYRDFHADESTLCALSGLQFIMGDPKRPPLLGRPRVVEYTGGLHAFIAINLALLHRARTGRGGWIDLSLQESAMENITIALHDQSLNKKTAQRKNDAHPLVPWEVHPCADGWAAIIGGPVRHWNKAATMFEEPRLLEPPFNGMGGRIKHRAELAELMRPWLSRTKKQDIYYAGQSRRLAFTYLATLAEASASPQHAARGFFAKIDHAEIGAARYAGPPFRPQASPWQSGAAPLLGEHTREICTDLLGLAPDAIATLQREGVL